MSVKSKRGEHRKGRFAGHIELLHCFCRGPLGTIRIGGVACRNIQGIRGTPGMLSLGVLMMSCLGCRHNRARGAREVHGGESHQRRADCAVQERAGAQHYHQARLCQRQNFQGRRPSMPQVMPLSPTHQRSELRFSVLRWLISKRGI